MRLTEWPRMPFLNDEVKEWITLELQSLGVEDLAVYALEAGAAYRATSLDAGRSGEDDDTTPLAERLSTGASSDAPVEERVLVDQLLSSLPEREAAIMRLRFYEDMTQSEIADRLGISQMHVSRLMRRSLDDLRAILDH